MISRWLLTTLFFVILSPGFLRAQAKSQAVNPIDPSAADSAKHEKMYEDIEILRRILDRKLQPLYPQTISPQNLGGMMGVQYGPLPPPGGGMIGGGMMGMQGGMMGMQGGMMGGMPNFTSWHREVRPTLEGAYLKGHGVVFSASLSSLEAAVKSTPVKPVSEWESVRSQLRNEKEEPKKSETSKPPSLSDVLLKVLAENGHHFARLGENESLTVVITVRETKQSATARKPTEKPAKAATTSPDVWKEGLAQGSKVRDLDLLGDLHMKQEHYGMARDAFREAIELKPSREQAAALARKLAQAYLMLGQIEEARQALDQAIAFKKEAGDAKDKPAPTPKMVVALPVKLIISAPKKLLVEMSAGKLTFEEFRRRASVETLRFEDHRPHK